MATAPKYQVFISSTYEDLKDERDQVIKAVLEMGHIPVGMEMFSAADEQQWQIIARHIDESDYYAVIIAHRLGSLTTEGVSYTRKEYEYARSKGIPCLGFVITPSASWPADRVDTNPTQVVALKEFKSLIQEKPVHFWSHAEDLHGKFSISLMKSLTAQPRDGWIRASDATAGPAATAEVIRLSAENGELRGKLAKAEKAAAEEKSEEVRTTIDTLRSTHETLSYRYEPTEEWQSDATKSLFDVFYWMGSEMLVESTVNNLATVLAMEIRTDTNRGWNLVATNQVKSVLADLLTLDLAHPSTKKHPMSDENEYWTLSSFGTEVLKRMRKSTLIQRTHTVDPEEPLTQEGADDNSSRDQTST